MNMDHALAAIRQAGGFTLEHHHNDDGTSKVIVEWDERGENVTEHVAPTFDEAIAGALASRSDP
jgi:hypothetical protein